MAKPQQRQGGVLRLGFITPVFRNNRRVRTPALFLPTINGATLGCVLPFKKSDIHLTFLVSQR
jgi:hypothetical protein